MPRTQVLDFFREEEVDQKRGEWVEFRLVYQGRLHANAGPSEKHEIRKAFHGQLKELWRQKPLSHWWEETVGGTDPPESMVSAISKQYERCNGYHFMPLVTEIRALMCELDILFLRRDPPGKVLSQGGDIDNRMKTLFDALRMPTTTSEVGNQLPGDGEDPFFVLLENDSLISKIAITTDRLLIEPVRQDHVHLIIGARIKVVNVHPWQGGSEENLRFL